MRNITSVYKEYNVPSITRKAKRLCLKHQKSQKNCLHSLTKLILQTKTEAKLRQKYVCTT